MHAFFQNTGKEREETLVFIDAMAKHWGVNIVWMEWCRVYGQPDDAPWYKIVDFESASRNGEVDGMASSLGVLIEAILKRNAAHGSPHLILNDAGKRVTAAMLWHRWDDAREEAVKEATAAGDQVLASRISQFQFRDIRLKAASEIVDVDHASLLLGHTKGDITERVYRRVGALAKSTNKQSIRTRPNTIASRGFPRLFPRVFFLHPKNAKSPE